MEWRIDSYVLTDARSPASVEQTHSLLASTYWAHQRPIELIPKLLENSLCFFLHYNDGQIGFARVVSDFITTSWICDVVLDAGHQGKGVGTWMMERILEYPSISETQFVLQTGTAQAFYRRLGFENHRSLMSTPVDYL